MENNTKEQEIMENSEKLENLNIAEYDNFDFNTLPDDVLNLCLKILENKKTILNITQNDKEIVLENNIFNFCPLAKQDTKLETFLTNLELEDNPKIENEEFYKEKTKKFNYKKVNKMCNECNYSRCPKAVLGYLKYLKDKNLLNKKVEERKEFLKDKTANNFFLFDWNPENGLKYVPEDLFNIANELVKRNCVSVKRNLSKEKKVEINTLYSCQNLEKINKIEDLDKYPYLKQEEYTFLKRYLTTEILGLNCSSFSCRHNACIILIAGYIYYLKKSDNEQKIIEDRNYYNEHKEEIKNIISSKLEEKIVDLKNKEIDISKNFIDNFTEIKYKVKNIDILISKLQNIHQKNLYCIIEGEEGLKQNELIDAIYKSLKTTEKIIEQKEDENSEETKTAKNKIVYKIEESLFQLSCSLVHLSKNPTAYNKYLINKIGTNRLYILDDIKGFVSSYKNYKKTAKTNTHDEIRIKQLEYTLDYLTSMQENTFIILKGTKEEIESLLNLDTKLKHIYEECYISINSLTSEELFEQYKKELNLDVFYKIGIVGEEKIKKQFIEFISLNRNLLPFKNLDLAKYLSMYSNSKDDVVLPENLYKKETLEESLNNIIGLNLVKEKIKSFEKYAIFNTKAPSYELKIPKQNMHMLFTGNPGTGKTTVARIIAKMLFDIGILKENKLIEVDRKDLVAEYTGQTAPKTMNVIEKALGGVLFIDEAYSLNQSSQDNYGTEAITTLIKAMEDKKDEFVVIFAGYKDEMKHFVDSNPGIASRIGYSFDFEDYSTNELLEIFDLKINKSGFEIKNEEIKETLKQIFDYFKRKKNFGNGRFVDKVIQEILIKHSENFKEENIKEITIEDIPTIENLSNTTKVEKGYAKEELTKIIGMENLKKKIIDFEDYVVFQEEAKKNGLKIPKQNMHMLFTGNPGTGKTTIARIIAKMLFDIGILKENKLIEVDRKDLVAEYTGQTAPKTMNVIEKALGGVLFIDEAYSLNQSSQDNYGTEAITTLIKAMEDKKDEFIVIFAGYKDEMKHFVDSNPGIASRIGHTFDFEDYKANELLEIFNLKITNLGFKLMPETTQKILEIMEYYEDVENFGNGRFVDKVIQETLIKHSKNKNIKEISIIKETEIPTIKELISTSFNGESLLNTDLITEKTLKKTAYHEIGHAYVGYKLFNSSNIKNISINPDGGSLGRVTHTIEKNSLTKGKTEMLNRIKVLLAGMGSEEIFLGEFQSGNVEDLNKATNICYDMITKYGMSSLGLGRILYPNELMPQIQTEINKILEKCYIETKEIIINNKEKIEKLANYLLKEKELTGEEFDIILKEIEQN